MDKKYTFLDWKRTKLCVKNYGLYFLTLKKFHHQQTVYSKYSYVP